MKSERAFVWVVTLLMAFVAAVFLFFPRSTVSELERRELRRCPTFGWRALLSGRYTSEVSLWFSDSEPYRDRFMALSMAVKAAESIDVGSEQISFHPTSTPSAPAEPLTAATDTVAAPAAEENAVVTNSGIIVVGKAPTVRALMAFSGEEKGAAAYARVMNSYAEAFADTVRIFCMPVPTSVEFFCPEKARSVTHAERPVLDHLFATLSDAVTPVDIYDTLQQHLAEPIYLRTDHHWAPLGAYYAARCFAEAAGVTVPDLADFDRHAMPGYVGSMFGYSQDPAVKASPEEFVYYTPRLEYRTHFIAFTVDSDYQIVGESREKDGPFFVTLPQGSSSAYSTFMGSDMLVTQVRTSSPCQRRLLVVKDSFGNAVPGYLFASFQEVHVIDFRYFPYAIRDYVDEHAITDILFVNNLSHACSGGAARHYREWLEAK